MSITCKAILLTSHWFSLSLSSFSSANKATTNRYNWMFKFNAQKLLQSSVELTQSYKTFLQAWVVSAIQYVPLNVIFKRTVRSLELLPRRVWLELKTWNKRTPFLSTSSAAVSTLKCFRRLSDSFVVATWREQLNPQGQRCDTVPLFVYNFDLFHHILLSSCKRNIFAKPWKTVCYAVRIYKNILWLSSANIEMKQPVEIFFSIARYYRLLKCSKQVLAFSI